MPSGGGVQSIGYGLHLIGYGLHLIADTHYEVPVAFEVTRASTSEVKMLPKMLETLFARAPEMVDRCDDFSADRGLDNAP